MLNRYFELWLLSEKINKSDFENMIWEMKWGIHVKKYILNVADRIICAEYLHSDWIIQNIDKKYLSKIEILHLGDTETFMSENLIQMLEDKFKI